jgi:hypothetical protein
MIRSVRALALAPVLLLAAAVAIPAGEVVLSELISYEKLLNASGGDELTHTFSQTPDKVRVTVRCKLKRGSFSWRVESPEGKVLWRHDARAKTDVELQEEFPGRQGEWRIVIDYEKAKGKYHIKMEQI